MARSFRLVLAGAVAVLGLAGAACAHKVVFPTSPTVPAADARAKVELDDNGNAQISLTVNHLATPDRLFPPRSVYVVWIQPPDEDGSNLGQLRLDENLKGRIVGITPFTRFRVVITAEDEATVRFPGSQVVLATDTIEAN